MATAKKPAPTAAELTAALKTKIATAKSARAAAAPKATTKERADMEGAMKAVDAIRQRAKAASPTAPTDHARIKKMYAKLAKDALGAIGNGSLGHVGSSYQLHLYAELHSDWLGAMAEALSLKTAVAARKVNARFKKLEKLHNNLIVNNVNDANGDLLKNLNKLSLSGKRSNDAAYEKLRAERDELLTKALKANGIGERKIYNF